MTTPLNQHNPFFERALVDHRELRRLVASVQDVCESAATSKAVEAARQAAPGRLGGLLDHIQAHFAQEEEGGYLEEAISLVPQIASQAAQLERQHAPLLNSLRGIVERAKTAARDAERWCRVHSDFEAFCKDLLAHEAAESRLIQQACHFDMGLTDEES
jgi:hypothetical protein